MSSWFWIMMGPRLAFNGYVIDRICPRSSVAKAVSIIMFVTFWAPATLHAVFALIRFRLVNSYKGIIFGLVGGAFLGNLGVID